MDALLAQYSITQIITFIVLLSIAIKGIVSFLDWAGARIREKIHKEDRPIDIEKKLDIIEDTHCKHITALKEKDEELQSKLNLLTDKINLLIDSDRNAIKAWITEQYYKFTEKGSIDTYSLNCIELRFKHYLRENGNSFIETLVKEIRELPKS